MKRKLITLTLLTFVASSALAKNIIIEAESFTQKYCCPVNPTAPYNNPSEMYPKHISDGFFI